MTLADRLKIAREKLGLSQKELAKALGVAYTSWLGYEDGANVPGGKVLEALARQGINLNWLLLGQGPMRLDLVVLTHPDQDHLTERQQWPAERAAEAAACYRVDVDQLGLGLEGQVKSLRRGDDRYCYIPLYNVRASAGGGAVVDQERVLDFLSFRSEWIRTTLHASPKDLYLIHVEGESMEPTLRSGDVILVDHREASTLPGDGIYVVRMDDTLLVKRLQRLPGNQVRVSSDNAAYQPFTVQLGEAIEVAIIGRVVWCGRRM